MNTWWQKVRTYWKGLPIESRGSIAIAIPLVCLIGSVIINTLLYQKIVTPSEIQVIWIEIAIGIFSTALAIRLLRQLAVELRKRELGLEESRNLLQTIVTNIVDGTIAIDPHGKVTTLNHAAEKMFGYTSTEAIGCDWQELLIERDDLTQKLNIRLPGSSKLIPTGKIWEAIGQRKNGEWFPLEVSINSIPFSDDLIAIVRDITERQKAKAKLEAKATELIALNASLATINDCLIQKNRELDQFAYITSHDLKAPLRAIASLSEWIEEDLDKHLSVETRSQMHLLRNRVHRMQSLLNGLLEYSRAGNNFTPITTVDVNALLTEIIQTIAPPTTFTIKIGSMPILNTCKQPLKQIFAHSIDNAIRHHPTKMGIVEISAIDLGDRYEFAIADDGDGIEPQFHDRIYTIFQTLQPRDVQENIGAGLAIVKKIAIAQGGTIQLESAAGNGAIFRFTWLKQPIVIEDITTKHKQ